MKTIHLFAAALMIAGSAQAQTAAAPAAKVTAPKPAAPVTKPAPAAKPVAAKVASGKMAVHTTPSGKKITYDCSKKGNANKKVCKA